MKKVWGLLVVITLVAVVISGCSTLGAESQTLTMAWLPNESGEDIKSARDVIGKVIEDATGKKVEHVTTTDYIIAIESIANGNADLAFLGPQSYIEANNKNDKVQAMVVPTGKSGTLDDAVYHSWLAVKKGNEDMYKDGEIFKIDSIAGKKFSFVSNSSTSGFKVPSAGIVTYFGKMDAHKGLEAEDLLEGGSSNFFSEVMYGGSHQGSAVNLITGKAEVAAFCDTCVNNYVELIEGEANTPGAVYKVKADAAEPFNTVVGEEFVLISVTPVLNSPFVVNKEKVDDETVKQIVDALTSEETANNGSIFIIKDSGITGLFSKTGDERFLAVEDKWFDPIRALSK